MDTGQWTHHGPQSASAMEPDQFFCLYSNRSVNQPLAAWQVPVIWGFIISVSLLICIAHRNVWINLRPRRMFGALLRPCGHLRVSKASLQNEIYSIWKLWRLPWLREREKNKIQILAWKWKLIMEIQKTYWLFMWFSCIEGDFFSLFFCRWMSFYNSDLVWMSLITGSIMWNT